MDAQVLFNAVLSVASIIGGIVLKSIYDAIQELRACDGQIHERINQMPNIYMRRDDFLAFGAEIKATLNRIEEKLDHKMDK